jgi:hypothetical protein
MLPAVNTFVAAGKRRAKRWVAFAAVVSALHASRTEGAVTLPLEILGPDKTIVSVEVTVPSGTKVTALWMQIHGLSKPDKGSVKINDGPWIDLNNKTVRVELPGKAFGGIGGGFGTIKMTLPLTRGAVEAGPNTIHFRFNDVARASIGYRVLRLNFLSGPSKVLPDSEFNDDDPRNWTPPIRDSAAIAEGKDLWYNKPLMDRGTPVLARCTDCHAHDGRDLKYFNYSNYSIIQRSKYHGLSQMEGEQIASYIRSLPTLAADNGRPWNPPYQPGPGLDSKPASDWAAGAGLEWVLDEDSKTLDYIFPGGITKEAIDFKKTINAREIPIAIQFPDWNHWLPEVHPLDAWGSAFSNARINKEYAQMRGLMTGDRVTSAKAMASLAQEWYADTVFFFGRSGSPAVSIPAVPWPMDYQVKYHSTVRWRVTKFWEVITEFSMEDIGREVLGPSANNRTWYDAMVFNSAPHFMHLEYQNNPINDGSANNWNYFSTAWYQLQITLNNSNKRPYGTTPIDWPYLHAFTQAASTAEVGSAGLLTLNLVTAAQSIDNGQSPRAWDRGWDPVYRANVFLLAPEGHWANVWTKIPSGVRKQVIEAYLQNWLAKTTSYPVEDYYLSDDPRLNGVFARRDEVVNLKAINPMGGRWIDRYWPLAGQFRRHHVDEQLITQLIDFGQKLWPSNDWNSLRLTGDQTTPSTHQRAEKKSMAKQPKKGTKLAVQ